MESIISRLQNRRASAGESKDVFTQPKCILPLTVKSQNDDVIIRSKQRRKEPRNQRNNRLKSIILYGDKSQIHSHYDIQKMKTVNKCHTHRKTGSYQFAYRNGGLPQDAFELRNINFFTKNEVKNSSKAYAVESNHFSVDKQRAIQSKQPKHELPKQLPKIECRHRVIAYKPTVRTNLGHDRKCEEIELCPWSQGNENVL